MSVMQIGDRIVSTCGSLYRGCEGVITLVYPPDDIGQREYGVTITTQGSDVLPPMEHQCLFDGTQFVRKEADLGREHDKPCKSCCCRLGGHTREVLP